MLMPARPKLVSTLRPGSPAHLRNKKREVQLS